MKKNVIQFHATPEELFEFIRCLRSETSFSLAIIGWKPFALRLIGKSEDFDFSGLNNIERKTSLRIVLSNQESLVSADSEGRFYDNNPGCVTIDIGECSPAGLGESALSFIASDLDAIKFVNKVVSKLKKMTTAGVIAVNPNTGANGKIRTHRYSQGAKTLSDNGVKLLSLTGWILIPS